MTPRFCSALAALAIASILAPPARADWPAAPIHLCFDHLVDRAGWLQGPGGDPLLVLHKAGAGGSPVDEYDVYRIPRANGPANDPPAMVFDSYGDYPQPSGFLPLAGDGLGGAWKAKSRVASVPQHSNHEVYAEFQSPGTFGGPWVVSNNAAEDLRPSVVPDGAGGAYVAWLRYTGSMPRLLQRITSTGAVAPGWPATGVTVWGPSQDAPAALLPDGSGGVWLLDPFGFQSTPTLFRFAGDHTFPTGWDGFGAPLGDVQANLASPLRLVAGDALHVFASWAEFDGLAYKLIVQRCALDGTIDDPLVLDYAGDPLTRANLVSDGAGGVWALWEDAGRPFASHVTANGAGALGPVSLVDAHAVYGASLDPLIGAAGASGGLVFMWDDARHSTPDVRVRWLLANGQTDPAKPDTGQVVVPVAYPTNPVPTPSGRVLYPDGSGGVLAVWSQVYFLANNYTDTYVTRLAHGPVTAVDDPAATRALALAAGPNPARERSLLRFTLRDATPARLEVLDVGGRRMCAYTVQGAGAHVQAIDGMAAWAPGVYLARLTQAGQQRMVRLVHTR